MAGLGGILPMMARTANDGGYRNQSAIAIFKDTTSVIQGK